MNHAWVFVFVIESVFWSFDTHTICQFYQIKVKFIHFNGFRQIKIFDPVFVFFLNGTVHPVQINLTALQDLITETGI